GIRAIAENRALLLNIERFYDQPCCECDQELSDYLVQAMVVNGHDEKRLPSGAGHDAMAMAMAMAMADLTAVAMLFVRCKDGISHNAKESMTGEDAASATAVVVAFLRGLEALQRY
ncbi:MAG: allantoate deiminase, partial [Gammaproteobacteria bacterium]